MSSCFRPGCYLPQRFLIFNCTSSLKFFSIFSPRYYLLRSDKHKLIYKKLNFPKLVEPRCFSLEALQSFNESISSSELCKLFRGLLIGSHNFTGLSWSLTLVGASLLMKLLISFPCGIYQQYLMSKLELIKIEMNLLAKSLQEKMLLKARKENWTKEKFHLELKREVRGHWKYLVVKNNCHPFKITILFFAQLPFWLALTVTIRKIATDSRANQLDSVMDAFLFQVQGPFWARNLTAPDPTFILPAVNFLAMLAAIELSLLNESSKILFKPSAKFYILKASKYLTRLFAVAFFFISAASPSALSLFWASSSVINLAQRFLIMSPTVRRFFKIPKTPSEVNEPYSQACKIFLEKYSKLFLRK